MTSININLFNMLFTQRPSFIADLARSLPATPLLIDVRKMAGRPGLFFASNILLHRRGVHSSTLATRRPATFLKSKGDENVTRTFNRYSAMRCVRSDGVCRLSGNSRHVEKFVTSLSDLYSIRHITDKLTNRMNNVKKKISGVKKCVLVTN